MLVKAKFKAPVVQRKEFIKVKLISVTIKHCFVESLV